MGTDTGGNTGKKISFVPENLGWLDRLIRFFIGTAMMSAAFTYFIIGNTTPTWLSEEAPHGWPYYFLLIAIYPFVTAILGRDPVYALFKIKSCDTSPRNVCGTFPFEIDTAMGHHPIPDSEIEHSLSMSHHQKKPAKHK
jgi:hypothetical protein